MTPEEAARLLLTRPAAVGRLCGYPLLRDDLHGEWLRQMLLGRGDMTLLAHRGSYKTTCLALAISVLMLTRPGESILFLRKTDEDAAEILRQVRLVAETPVMRALSQTLYGRPVRVLRAAAGTLTLDCYRAMRGQAQLLGLGTGASLTGKHAEWIFTDDIVNLRDRVSPPERERVRGVYMELQNLRVPGGRIINTGTPWHPEDALSLMPSQRRYDCYTTGLLTAAQITGLRRAMSPSLFAANYELKHIASEEALFREAPQFTADECRLWDGIAHVDAAYGGGDFTALTLARLDGSVPVLYGRLWPGHVDGALDGIAALCDRYRCAPLWCETNGDKGYLAAEMRKRGLPVRAYCERSGKYMKIATQLRPVWERVTFLEGTDPEYLRQILDYNENAAHDDAPDSAACAMRILLRRG